MWHLWTAYAGAGADLSIERPMPGDWYRRHLAVDVEPQQQLLATR